MEEHHFRKEELCVATIGLIGAWVGLGLDLSWHVRVRSVAGLVAKLRSCQLALYRHFTH